MSIKATEECQHGSMAPGNLLRELNDSQGGMGRHKCAACAYIKALAEVEDGVSSYGKLVQCSHGNVAPESILQSLPDNQGGSGRHKCVVCAYHQGHAHARGVAIDSAWDPTASSETGGISQSDDAASRPPSDLEDEGSDEARLKEIGDVGEALVLDYEKGALIAGGRIDLANEVSHVAVEEGDSAGYDIRSFESDGTVKYIEVKATEGNLDKPFFLTANELRFAKVNSIRYFLYRLFELDIASRTAQFAISAGDPEDHYKLTPTQYHAIRK